MRKALLPLVALVVAAPLAAQETIPAPGADALATMKGNFNYVKGLIVDSAAEMPEADYGFKLARM